MKRFFVILCALPLFALALIGQDQGSKEEPKCPKHTTAPPIHQAKGVIASPYSGDHFKFARGLKPTPRHRLIAAPRFKAMNAAPSQVLMLPKQLSMWGNDQYGDCVSASEAAAKAAYSVYCGLPETFVPEATVIAWARRYGYLNGAMLPDVMDTMQKNGMVADDSKTYTDGPYLAVDYSNEAVLQAALVQGPVNLGLDANALPSAAGNQPGWYAFGGRPEQFQNEDHCCRLFGYGPTKVLFEQISQVYGVNVAPPANAPATGYLFFTWSTVGVVDHAWLMSTVAEAWLCNPTTPGQSPPTPTPPVPPGPSPAGVRLTVSTNGGITYSFSRQPAPGVYELVNPDRFDKPLTIRDLIGPMVP